MLSTQPLHAVDLAVPEKNSTKLTLFGTALVFTALVAMVGSTCVSSFSGTSTGPSITHTFEEADLHSLREQFVAEEVDVGRHLRDTDVGEMFSSEALAQAVPASVPPSEIEHEVAPTAAQERLSWSATELPFPQAAGADDFQQLAPTLDWSEAMGTPSERLLPLLADFLTDLLTVVGDLVSSSFGPSALVFLLILARVRNKRPSYVVPEGFQCVDSPCTPHHVDEMPAPATPAGFFPPSPWRTGNELSLAAAPSPVPALTEHAPVEAPRRNLMAATVQVGAFYECQVDGVDTIVKALSQIDDGTVLAERYVASRTGSGRVKVRKVKTCDAMLHVRAEDLHGRPFQLLSGQMAPPDVSERFRSAMPQRQAVQADENCSDATEELPPSAPVRIRNRLVVDEHRFRFWNERKQLKDMGFESPMIRGALKRWGGNFQGALTELTGFL